MKKLLIVSFCILFLFSGFALAADLRQICKDGSRPADEMQYRTACTMFKNYTCCWQRWKKAPTTASTEMTFDCWGISPIECGEKISLKAIDWVIKNDPQNEVWIRADVAKYDEYFKGALVTPPVDPVPPPVDPVTPPVDPVDCSICQEAVSTCNDKITRIQGILNE